MSPTRRQLLSLVAVGATASSGCLFRDTHDDSELAIHFDPVPASALGREFLFAPERWTPAQRTFLADGVANATEAYGYRPFDPGVAVRTDGTYYAVSVAENGTATVRRPVLRAEQVSDAPGEVGDFEGLGETDALALRCAVVSARREGPEPCVLHAGNRSAFWPEPEFRYFEHRNEYYRLAATEAPVELARYDYRFEPVARNQSAFAAYAASEMLAVDYGDRSLSAEERSILETAAAEGVYRESPPYSDALRGLVEDLRGRADHHRSYVRFRGSYYLAWSTRTFDD